jgi:uncharacterized protein YbbK (DUF523 family)
MAAHSLSKILISACLLGQAVRYNGTYRLAGHEVLARWQQAGRLVSLCPEVAVGFPTPRAPVEIASDSDGADVLAGSARLFEDTGRDVTELYLAAARLAVERAVGTFCRYAVLTDGSPSCGTTFVYDGTFRGITKSGRGTTAAALEAAGIAVFAESEIEKLDSILAATERS